MSEPARDPTEVEAMLALVRGRHGERLTPEQLEALRPVVENLVDVAAALRAVRLGNADEPLQRFVPFRADT